MLVNEFSRLLSAYKSNDSFGAAEIDDHFVPFDEKLKSLNLCESERVFCILLSFIIYQGTEWDAFAIQGMNSDVLPVILSHGRAEKIPFDYSQQVIYFKKPPIERRLIELVPITSGDVNISTLRAPAVCFLAFEDSKVFIDHLPFLKANHLNGQAYGFLLVISEVDVERTVSSVKTTLEKFHVSFWMDGLDANKKRAVITLITTGIDLYEI